MRLCNALETKLTYLLKSIAILSKGYFPLSCSHIPMVEISQKVIAMVKSKNPDYGLALLHNTDYNDKKLVPFGLDDQDR